MSSCDSDGNCYIYNKTDPNYPKGAILKTNCGADYCTCLNGKCTSVMCSGDKDCSDKFGNQSGCVNSVCTNYKCEIDSECPKGTVCYNNQYCFAKRCSDSSPCENGYKCSDGFCVKKRSFLDRISQINPFIRILFLLILVLIICGICFAVYQSYKKRKLNKNS